jgi:Cft2 family RNA processing exonuclease
VRDAEAVRPLFSTVNYGQPVVIGPGLEAVFHNAGHILGSAWIKVTVTQGTERRSIVFSGDVGRWNQRSSGIPNRWTRRTTWITESTYGDRLHGDNAHIPDALAALIHETRRRGGNLVIPSFAVERSQELLYYLSGLTAENRIPNLMVFLDSPMAVSVTEVFKRHQDLFDAATTRLLTEGRHPCEFRGLHLSRTVEESKAINNVRGSAVIIAGSGMCTGGRIKHHLVANIEREESIILFIGYQAVGTLGRIILDGAGEVRIHGKTRTVRASGGTYERFLRARRPERAAPVAVESTASAAARIRDARGDGCGAGLRGAGYGTNGLDRFGPELSGGRASGWLAPHATDARLARGFRAASGLAGGLSRAGVDDGVCRVFTHASLVDAAETAAALRGLARRRVR